MPVPVSRAYAMVANLRAAADEHKARCADPACNVSLWLMRQTAELLTDSLTAVEQRDARERFIEGWPR